MPIKHRSGDVADQTVLDAGGLQLVVICTGGDENLMARTTVTGGEVRSVSNPASAPGASAGNAELNEAFDPGDSLDLDGALPAANRSYRVHYLGGDGNSVTAHVITDDAAGTSNCVVSGYAVVI